MKRILLDSGLDPYALFAASRDDHPHAFILESLTGPARLAEHTFVGFDPEIIISYRSGILRSNGETVKTERPLEALRSILAKYEAPGVPGRYIGGLVGYVSYEFVRNLDSVPAHADSPFPEFEFGLYLDGLVFDHLTRKIIYFSHGVDRSPDVPGHRSPCRADHGGEQAGCRSHLERQLAACHQQAEHVHSVPVGAERVARRRRTIAMQEIHVNQVSVVEQRPGEAENGQRRDHEQASGRHGRRRGPDAGNAPQGRAAAHFPGQGPGITALGRGPAHAGRGLVRSELPWPARLARPAAPACSSCPPGPAGRRGVLARHGLPCLTRGSAAA